MKDIHVNGIRLAYRDEGSGKPLLLIHAFPLDHSMWDSQVEAFSSRRRVLVPDLRGFGRSQLGAEVVTMEQFADDLAGLLAALRIEEPVTVGGLSMGGYIAFAFWRKYPERIASLLLCDTKAKADTPINAELRRKTARSFLDDGMDAAAEDMSRKLLSPKSLAERPRIVEAVRATIRGTHPLGAAAANRGMAQRPDMVSELGRIAVPVLLVVGEEDGISPPDEMAQIAADIPGARLEIIPEAGHLAPLENPAAFNEAVAVFLQ